MYAAAQRAIWFEASGARKVMRQQIEEIERRTAEKRQRAKEELTRLLAEAQAEPEPNPTVVAAYTRLLAELEEIERRNPKPSVAQTGDDER